MKKNNKIPKLRFSGYTDDWERRKLSEVVKEVKRTDETSDAPVMMITAENGFINQSERYSTNNAGQSLKKYILLEKGELAYNHGASKLRPFGSCFALISKGKARIPFVYHCFSSKSENAEFLSLTLNGKPVERQLRRIVSSGARMDGLLNISFEEYTAIPISLPQKAEQDRIADYFRSLDCLITLYQRKLEKLQNMKKSCLQKMFPKDGATVPEIRFSEFQGDWEERTLGSCFDERLESLPDGELLSVTIGSGIKKFSELDRHDNSNTDKSKYKRVCIGDIAYNSMRMWQGASGRSPYEGIVSPAYTVVKPIGDIDTQFFAYMFKKKEIIHLFEINSQGLTSDTWNLKYPAFSKIVVRVPRNVEEQSRIARFLLELDELISCTEQEIEITKRMKKGCLQKMFV